MFVLFHGDNSYDSWTELLELAAKNAQQYSVVYGEEIRSLADIFKNNDNFSFFRESLNSTIIIKRLSVCKLPTVFKSLEEKLKAGMDTSIFVWEDQKLEKTDKLIRIATKYGQVKLYKALDKVGMKKFVMQELAKDELKISETVINELLLKLPLDKYAILNELHKIIELVRSQKRKEVMASDLEMIVINEIESQIWDLTEAISKKDKKKSLQLLNKIFKRNEDFPLIVGALANQLELLYLIKLNLPASELTSKFKIHPFVLEKNKYFVRDFEFAQLKILFSKLANLDYNIKQGKIDAKLGLNLLITTL
jgi:DNA polymerase-3 subunit delta